jgi:hypothetical protein
MEFHKKNCLVGAELFACVLTNTQTDRQIDRQKKTRLIADTANSRYHKFTSALYTTNNIYYADRKLTAGAQNLLSSYAQQRQ